jgi:dTDP-4-dehydrorhamnose reductase
MKIAIIGAKGMLGAEFYNFLSSYTDFTVFPFDLPGFDVTDYNTSLNALVDLKPDSIINCAAYTKVDLAEKNQNQAALINIQGSKNLSLISKTLNAVYIYFSTDYVFSGENKKPYTENDTPKPINSYGYTKFEGEKAALLNNPKSYVLRISWLYGQYGENFVSKILNMCKQNDNISIVDDQWGTPTRTLDVVRQTLKILETKACFGIYHASSEGYTTWYNFALEIKRLTGLNCKIAAVTSSGFQADAKRPSYSILENKKLKEKGINIMPFWKNSLKDFLLH